MIDQNGFIIGIVDCPIFSKQQNQNWFYSIVLSTTIFIPFLVYHFPHYNTKVLSKILCKVSEGIIPVISDEMVFLLLLSFYKLQLF